MHEISLARYAADVACHEAKRAGGGRVRRAYLRTGALRMIDSWLMQQAWVIACEGTLCEGSELVVDRVEPTIRCSECGRTSEATGEPWQCPACGCDEGRICGGDELELTKLDVDSADGAALATSA